MKTIDTDKPTEFAYSWAKVENTRTYGTVPLKLKLYQPKGNTLEEVKEEVKGMKTANLAVQQYLYEHPEDVPEEFKGYWCYFFGTELRDGDGYWHVPYGYWGGAELDRDAGWLSFGWGSRDRVVLLDDSSPLNLETLSLRLAKLEAFYEKAVELVPSLGER